MAASIEEMRQWGQDNGWDVPDEGRLPPGLRAAYDSRDRPRPAMHQPSVVIEEGVFAGLPPIEDDDDLIQERAPQVAKSTPIRNLAETLKKAVPAKPAAPRGRKAAKPRVAVDRLISKLWQGLAQLAQPINLPVARVLDVQAPVAGLLLEDMVKNTIVDRFLQPLARIESGGEVAFALMGPPLLVAAIQAKPEMQMILVPLLKESLRTWIDVAGPKLEEVAKRDQAFQEKYGQRIDDMIAMFFAVPDESGL